MKKIAIPLLMLSQLSWAVEWTHLSEDSDGNSWFYVQPAEFPQPVLVVTRIDFAKGPVTRALRINEIDCKGKLWRTTSTKLFNQGDTFVYNTPSAEWEVAPKESIAEELINKVCQGA